MAEGKKPRLLLRPRVLLFMAYLLGYGALRFYGEIVHQVVDRRDGATVVKQYMIVSSVSAPRWRRQLYRAFFSAPMVAEEELVGLVYGGGGSITEFIDYLRGFLPD